MPVSEVNMLESLDGVILFVRHAYPIVDPHNPAAAWSLSPDGRRMARQAGQAILPFAPAFVVASPELKAFQTGEEIAAIVGCNVTPDTRLREQGSAPVPFVDDARFRAQVVAHFQDPELAVPGGESARAAAHRFGEAVAEVCETGRSLNAIPVVVSHGRIMSSWLATIAGGLESGGAEEIWKSLRFPDVLLVDRAQGTFQRILLLEP